MRRILCAAIWYDDKNNYKGQPLNIQSGYVVAGLRHNNCIATNQILSGRPTKQTDVQGFLTTTNVFTTREEAGKIAFEAGQIKSLTACLISEDLY